MLAGRRDNDPGVPVTADGELERAAVAALSIALLLCTTSVVVTVSAWGRESLWYGRMGAARERLLMLLLLLITASM